MKKQIMSIAAAAALFTTGAMAFETNTVGKITKGKYSIDANTFDSIAETISPVRVGGIAGDALIYPAFFSGNGWSSEFTVTNSSNKAVMAKVVLYRAKDSMELKDFNIYLSPFDTFSAKIYQDAEGVQRLYSVDGSTPTTSTAGDVATFASESKPKNSPIERAGKVYTKGYVAIYGMAQVATAAVANGNDYSTSNTTSFHGNHKGLYKAYRKALDECRTTSWRTSVLKEGIYVDGTIPVPSVKEACSTTTALESVDNVLFGTMKVTNDTNGAERDMIVNAVGLRGFTDAEQLVLWTEGEFAAIQDRAFTADSTGVAKYDKTAIEADATANEISAVHYAFNDIKKAPDQQMILTSPWKRIIVQLGDTANYYTGVNLSKGYYGAMQVKNTIYNTDEKTHNAVVPSFIDSPASNTVSNMTIPFEVAITEASATNNIKKEQTFSHYIKQSGFKRGYLNALFLDNVGAAQGVPVIVTEMTASDVNGQALTNWKDTPFYQ